MSYMNARPIDHRMTTAEWAHLFKFSCFCPAILDEKCQCRPDSTLRQYFIDQAKALSHDKDLQEDFFQEAWMAAGESPAGKRIEYYQNVGFKAMDRYRYKNRRSPQTRNARHQLHKRVNRVVKKYYLRGRRPVPESS